MLVNELQEVTESQDILTVLRKAKRVAGKLGRNDILDWIKNELDGYDGKNVPKYRMVDCRLVYQIDGHLRVGGYLVSGVQPVAGFPTISLPIGNPVGMLLEASSTNMFCLPVPHDLEKSTKNALMNSDNCWLLQNVTLLQSVPYVNIKQILQSVRDVVLDWAIRLEQEGVLGENQTFTDIDKQKAATVQFIFGDNAVVGAVGQDSKGQVTKEV